MSVIFEPSHQFSSGHLMTSNVGVDAEAYKISGVFSRKSGSTTVDMTNYSHTHYNTLYKVSGRNAITTIYGRLLYRDIDLEEVAPFTLENNAYDFTMDATNYYWGIYDNGGNIDENRQVFYPELCEALWCGDIKTQAQVDAIAYTLRRYNNIKFVHIDTSSEYSDATIDFSNFNSIGLKTFELNTDLDPAIFKGLDNMHFPKLEILNLNTSGSSDNKTIIMRVPARFTNLRILALNGPGCMYGEWYDFLTLRKLEHFIIPEWNQGTGGAEEHVHVNLSFIPFMPSLKTFYLGAVSPIDSSLWSSMTDEDTSRSVILNELNNKYYGYNRWRFNENCNFGIGWYNYGNETFEVEI